MEMIGDILLDAVLDSVKLVPFLYLVYVLIGYLEGQSNNKLYQKMVDARWGGPVIGALIGCMPQCGFSVVGSNLYSKGLIGMGTLIAIFVSTSDEAIPIMLAEPSMFKLVIVMLVLKVLFAVVIGLAIEAAVYLKKGSSRKLAVAPVGEMESVVCSETDGCSCCHHDENTESIWVYALRHSIKILIFIFFVNLVLGFLIEGFGEAHIRTLLLTDSVFQPALAALIGLIPNCAASVVLTEMFVGGTLSFGSLIAGLSTGAGVGLVVLFKANKNKIDNLKIVGILYIAGTLCGMLVQLIG